MKKRIVALCTIALLVVAPSVFACAECFWPTCEFTFGSYFLCWVEWSEGCWSQYPGCGDRVAQLDLASEFSVASVEVRQGTTLVAQANDSINEVQRTASVNPIER